MMPKHTARRLGLPIAAALQLGCSRASHGESPARTNNLALLDASAPVEIRGTSNGSEPGADAAPPATRAATIPEPRDLHFAWQPLGARRSVYAMVEPQDQHTIRLLRGVERGHAYPVVLAFHGQPRRGHAPSTYAFPRTVARVADELVNAGEVAPFVLVTPVFRFEGQNWPNFDVVDFLGELKRLLDAEGIALGRLYVVGHSGAAGCGGSGLNDVAKAAPAAVGFFDTCVGAGFLSSVRALQARSVPTFIAHSVETAGFQPREPTEYEAEFDFGKVYSKVGLAPTSCPEHLPDAPLRKLAYRCAGNGTRTTLALVIDTGEGEKAHEALVPVALRYFIREYVHANSR